MEQPIILSEIPIKPNAPAISIPEFLVNCPEFNSDKGSFHVNDIKCPITRKKAKEFYKIPDEDDEETKRRKFDEAVRKRTQEQDQAVKNVKALTERNVILEEHARQTEEDLKSTKESFETYKTQTETRLNKLASLIQQLIK